MARSETAPEPVFETATMTPPRPPDDAAPTISTTTEPTRQSEPSASSATSVLPEPSRDSELLGQAAPNQQYLGQRLLFREGEAESLDPLSPRFLKAILVHASIVYVIWAVGALVLAVIFGAILHSTTLTFLFEGLWWLITGIVFWWAPVWVSLSEWKFMLDGMGPMATSAFEHIASVFRRRRTPVSGLKVQRLSLGGGRSRDYLYVHDDVFRGYVSCFAYGHDLYVGWSLWWRISPARWLWLAVVRTYQALTLRGFELHRIHRYDSAKALREALHTAAREGLDAVNGLVSFSGQGTIGSEIPIELIEQPETGAPAFR